MTETIKAGSILIKEGTPLPQTLQFETESGVPGWRLVQDFNGYALDRKIREAGWTFFYMASEIEATVIGSTGQRRAIARILNRLKPDNLNSLEITRTISKRFLGVPYTSVSAHSRHIQESVILSQTGGLPQSDQVKHSATIMQPEEAVISNFGLPKKSEEGASWISA